MTTTKVNLANTVEGILPVANGGTGTSTGVAPGGSNTQVQFNNAGAFGGDSGFVYTGGNVGIGKAPEAQAGFTILDLGSSSTSGLIDLRQNGSRQLRIFNSSTNSFLSNTADGGSLVFQTTSGALAERMRIDSSGNVGIGTSSPAGRLHVVGTNDQIRAGNGTNTAFLGASGSSGYTGTLTNDPFLFFTNSAERMRIDSSGNLCVNTTSATSVLTVRTGGSSSGTLSLAAATGGGGGSWIVMGNADSGGTAGPSVMGASNRTMYFGVGNSFTSGSGGTFTEYMRITSGGNVGIGMTDPEGFSSRLCIAGGRLTMASGNRIGFWESGNLGRVEINSPAYHTMAFYRNDGLTESMRIDANGAVFVGGTTQNGANGTVNAANTAKAWVRFNGQGGASINASFNVSSVSRFGGGEYTINFTNALADANYACGAMTYDNGNNGRVVSWNNNGPQSASQLSITVVDFGYNRFDANRISVIVHR